MEGTPAAPLGRRVRHEPRRRVLEVRRVERLTPRMLRVVLGGAELEGFHSPAFDDHVKLFFPLPGAEEPAPADTGPDGPRPPARDYTPRRHDAARGELAIDFALHAEGPATEWAAAARPGDRLVVGGPRGSLILPDDLDWTILAGDETALPAIGRRLEELPAATRAVALIEVADAAERQDLPARPGLEIRWLERNGAPAGEAERLEPALAALAIPPGEGHAWVAGEAEVARRLRRVLTERHGIPKERVKAAGYWRRGAVAAHEVVGD
ncbi:siderophore-interacting protein [Roseomonas nepalensis]|uniref:Siderophore-interacting protein n=1 Tax=Muricoccus nepalensis TaxID=1854500 RepID=A0A502GFH4_9PROT|nr:siderophore-interacting protein [Roseomonas nepalensis]TPG61067.1 siderophore-interacting protein [Roseomonas nepalensis]